MWIQRGNRMVKTWRFVRLHTPSGASESWLVACPEGLLGVLLTLGHERGQIRPVG
jgi:hypothetical protein